MKSILSLQTLLEEGGLLKGRVNKKRQSAPSEREGPGRESERGRSEGDPSERDQFERWDRDLTLLAQSLLSHRNPSPAPRAHFSQQFFPTSQSQPHCHAHPHTPAQPFLPNSQSQPHSHAHPQAQAQVQHQQQQQAQHWQPQAHPWIPQAHAHSQHQYQQQQHQHQHQQQYQHQHQNQQQRHPLQHPFATSRRFSADFGRGSSVSLTFPRVQSRSKPPTQILPRIQIHTPESTPLHPQGPPKQSLLEGSAHSFPYFPPRPPPQKHCFSMPFPIQAPSPSCPPLSPSDSLSPSDPLPPSDPFLPCSGEREQEGTSLNESLILVLLPDSSALLFPRGTPASHVLSRGAQAAPALPWPPSTCPVLCSAVGRPLHPDESPGTTETYFLKLVSPKPPPGPAPAGARQAQGGSSAFWTGGVVGLPAAHPSSAPVRSRSFCVPDGSRKGGSIGKQARSRGPWSHDTWRAQEAPRQQPATSVPSSSSSSPPSSAPTPDIWRCAESPHTVHRPHSPYSDRNCHCTSSSLASIHYSLASPGALNACSPAHALNPVDAVNADAAAQASHSPAWAPAIYQGASLRAPRSHSPLQTDLRLPWSSSFSWQAAAEGTAAPHSPVHPEHHSGFQDPAGHAARAQHHWEWNNWNGTAGTGSAQSGSEQCQRSLSLIPIRRGHGTPVLCEPACASSAHGIPTRAGAAGATSAPPLRPKAFFSQQFERPRPRTAAAAAAAAAAPSPPPTCTPPGAAAQQSRLLLSPVSRVLPPPCTQHQQQKLPPPSPPLRTCGGARALLRRLGSGKKADLQRHRAEILRGQDLATEKSSPAPPDCRAAPPPGRTPAFHGQHDGCRAAAGAQVMRGWQGNTATTFEDLCLGAPAFEDLRFGTSIIGNSAPQLAEEEFHFATSSAAPISLSPAHVLS